MTKIKCANMKIEIAFEAHVKKWGGCISCKSKIGHRVIQHVIGKGTLPCDVLVIGEAPGEIEDRTGFPFMARAGNLLHKLLVQADPDSAYFYTNTLACRPVDETGKLNRRPHKEEQVECSLRIKELYKIAQPRRVLVVGKSALHAVQDIYTFIDVPVNSIFTPSYLLKNGWENGKLYNDTVVRVRRFVSKEATICG